MRLIKNGHRSNFCDKKKAGPVRAAVQLDRILWNDCIRNENISRNGDGKAHESYKKQ